MRWSKPRPSKLVLQTSHQSEKASVMPAIMPITQHHAAFLGPMTGSCARRQVLGGATELLFTEHLLCARPCAVCFCICSFLKGIRALAGGLWAILPLGSHFFRLDTFMSFSNDSFWYDEKVVVLDRPGSTMVGRLLNVSEPQFLHF